ncbi:helix-turn-helix domain-containing protein [Candidatus Omnitrophota bacterium]
MEYKRLVTLKEMAAILRVNKNWLYQRTRLGQKGIPHIKVGGHIRFMPDKVLQFLMDKGDA